MSTKWIHNKTLFLYPCSLFSSKTRQTVKRCQSYPNPVFIMLLSICCIISFLVVPGCGYVSTSSYLEHIRSINIPPIDIQDPDFAYDEVSQRPFDEVIHEKLTQRFNRKWNDGNDSELTILIQNYDIKEQGYGPSGNVEMLRMTLQVEYRFLDKVRDNLITQTNNHLQIHDFYIVENRGEPPETLDQAKNLIVEELIEDLYNQLAEQW